MPPLSSSGTSPHKAPPPGHLQAPATLGDASRREAEENKEPLPAPRLAQLLRYHVGGRVSASQQPGRHHSPVRRRQQLTACLPSPATMGRCAPRTSRPARSRGRGREASRLNPAVAGRNAGRRLVAPTSQSPAAVPHSPTSGLRPSGRNGKSLSPPFPVPSQADRGRAARRPPSGGEESGLPECGRREGGKKRAEEVIRSSGAPCLPPS